MVADILRKQKQRRRLVRQPALTALLPRSKAAHAWIWLAHCPHTTLQKRPLPDYPPGWSAGSLHVRKEGSQGAQGPTASGRAGIISQLQRWRDEQGARAGGGFAAGAHGPTR